MEDSSENEIGLLRKQVSEYADIRLRLLKLDIYEKLSLLGASLLSSMIVVILTLFFITSVFLAVAFYLGSVFKNYGLGFLVSGGIYLILLLLFVLVFRKPMKQFIISKIIQLFMHDDEQD